MGYKRAGFEVIGNVEIDPKINDMYQVNNHPKYSFNMDLREFNNARVPDELYGIDILDGSPPCTTFSMAGKREKTWGQEKKFREGQAKQRLDDLFFTFLDTVEKLKPKIVIAENVMGLISGNAKGYVREINQRFKELGYEVQLFALNSAYMDVPQNRRRVFFIANNQGFRKLHLEFKHTPITFGEVRGEKGIPEKPDSVLAPLLKKAATGDRTLCDTCERLTGEKDKYFGSVLVTDEDIAPTITSAGQMYRMYDRMRASDEDIISCQTFPQDYDFCGQNVKYVCGMSVPPNMMANIASEVYEQWLK